MSAIERHGSDDAGLVRRLQAGDQEAFEEFYAGYFKRIYGYFRIALGNPAEAEDEAQEVFTRILAALPRYEERGVPFEAWIFRIARNRALDRLAKGKAICVGDAVDVERAGLREAERTLEEMVLARASDEKLLGMIARLSEHQRKVIVMRYFLDMGWPEIAGAMHSTPARMYELHRKAFRVLRPRLAVLFPGLPRVPAPGG